jgi:hydrogenase maturation protease
MTAPHLVLAWGNRSRGDDALGPLFAEQLRQAWGPRDDVEFLEDYQLQVEHALDLVGRKQVLFVDASVAALAPFELSTPLAQRDGSFTSHAMSPQAVLQVFEALQGHAPPPCTLLAIRGESFALGAEPTAAARAHLALALEWAQTGWPPRQTPMSASTPHELLTPKESA